jgi:hypothetical protein
MKSSVLWDVMLCSSLKGHWRVRGKCRSACHLIHAVFFLSLIINPEDGGNIFFRNICLLSVNYTALYDRKLFVNICIAMILVAIDGVSCYLAMTFFTGFTILCVCVCARAHVCVRARACVCVCVCVCVKTQDKTLSILIFVVWVEEVELAHIPFLRHQEIAHLISVICTLCFLITHNESGIETFNILSKKHNSSLACIALFCCYPMIWQHNGRQNN